MKTNAGTQRREETGLRESTGDKQVEGWRDYKARQGSVGVTEGKSCRKEALFASAALISALGNRNSSDFSNCIHLLWVDSDTLCLSCSSVSLCLCVCVCPSPLFPPRVRCSLLSVSLCPHYGFPPSTSTSFHLISTLFVLYHCVSLSA